MDLTRLSRDGPGETGNELASDLVLIKDDSDYSAIHLF